MESFPGSLYTNICQQCSNTMGPVPTPLVLTPHILFQHLSLAQLFCSNVGTAALVNSEASGGCFWSLQLMKERCAAAGGRMLRAYVMSCALTLLACSCLAAMLCLPTLQTVPVATEWTVPSWGRRPKLALPVGPRVQTEDH